MDRKNAKIKVTMVGVLLSNNVSPDYLSTYTCNMYNPLHIYADMYTY